MCVGWSIANAAGWRATQNNVNHGGHAYRGIDGNTNTKYTSGQGCTHTNTSFKPWFAIDFGDSETINNVTLWNRADCCSERLRMVEIRVGSTEPTGTTNAGSNALCASVAGPLVGGNHTFQCGVELQGRYLTIQLVHANSSTEVLTLCEVIPNWQGE
jgi:hypothetical protein